MSSPPNPHESSIQYQRSKTLGATQGASTYSVNYANNLIQSLVGKRTFKEDQDTKIITQRIETIRPKPRIIYKQTESTDEEETEQFMVNPAEDIPRNKLVDKLVRGLQSYI